MSVSIDQAFVKQFEADVHLAYQQMGTKLRSTVRTKSNVVGQSTTFQKVGRGMASTKSRHGIVPVMNLNHTPVECTLQDYYAGDWVDALDELKVNVDERRVVASAGAYALGRKTDELIVSAMNSATTYVGDYTTGLTKTLILSALEKLNEKDVPDFKTVKSFGQIIRFLGLDKTNEVDIPIEQSRNFEAIEAPKKDVCMKEIQSFGNPIGLQKRASKETVEDVDDYLYSIFEHAFEFSKDGKYQLCEIAFSWLSKAKNFNEKNRTMSLFNFWMAKLWGGSSDALLLNEIRSFDVSAKEVDFKIAKCILLEQYDEATGLIEASLTTDESLPANLLQWPLYLKYRQSKHFKKLLRKNADKFGRCKWKHNKNVGGVPQMKDVGFDSKSGRTGRRRV